MRTPNAISRAARTLAVLPTLTIGAVLTVATLAAGPSSAAEPNRYDPSRLKTPPLHPIATVTPKRVVLKNGIVAYLLEDHTLPVVKGIAYIKGNPTWVPRDRVGLGVIMGLAMRSGGTAKHPGDELDDRLAAIGASISTGYDGRELANAGFRCLNDNTAEVITRWAEVMREPALPDAKIELAKVGLRREIASRNDDLTDVMFRTTRRTVYGKDNIWAWSRDPEYASVEAVTRADCVALHRKVFEPKRMVLALYGDFHAADITKLLEAHLGDWKGADEPMPPIPAVPTDSKPRLVFASKEDVTQSGVLVAHAGFRADDPDYAAMQVYQVALGGGFQSRLVNKVRTERGLAYDTGAIAGDGYVRPGIFIAYSLTKSESTMTALDLVRDEVRRSVEQPFTDEEIRLARNTVENTFVFNFEQPSDILFRSAYYEAIGYPQDFLQRYQKALAAVTGESVTAAARRKVHPDQLVAVVVGKEQDFDRALASAGLPVEKADIATSPPATAPRGPAAPGASEQGRQWLRRAAELAGGSVVWRKPKSVRLEQSSTVTMQGRSMASTSTLLWRFPDRIESIRRLPFGETKLGFDGKTGWSSLGPQIKDEPNLSGYVRHEWERSLFHLFGAADEVTVEAAEPKTIDGVAYRVGRVTSGTVSDLMLYFAPDGTLARLEYSDDGPSGPSLQTEILSNWKAVGALRYPHARKVLVDREPYLESTVTRVVFDAPIEDSAFKKPGS